MAATYDSNLPDDLDHVRFLIGDTDVANPLLQDGEIVAVIAEETATNARARKYFAAARCLMAIQSKYLLRGKGVTHKSVSRLSITYGFGGDISKAIDDRICELRKRGARLLSADTYPVRVL